MVSQGGRTGPRSRAVRPRKHVLPRPGRAVGKLRRGDGYREAAKQGHVEAQNALGNMYYHGLGVQPNYVLAYMWSNLAVANRQSRNEVAEKMNSAQIAEGQSMSERCLRSNYADCDLH
jgi:hypothetical protein